MCPMHRQCIANASPMKFFSFFLGVLLVRRMGCGWVAREAWAAGHSDGTWPGAKGWIHWYTLRKRISTVLFSSSRSTSPKISIFQFRETRCATLPKAWSWEVDSRSCRRKMSSTLLVVVKQARCWSPSSTTALCWCALVSHYCRKNWKNQTALLPSMLFYIYSMINDEGNCSEILSLVNVVSNVLLYRETRFATYCHKVCLGWVFWGQEHAADAILLAPFQILHGTVVGKCSYVPSLRICMIEWRAWGHPTT